MQEVNFLAELRSFPGLRASVYEYADDRTALESLGTLTPLTAALSWVAKYGVDYAHGKMLGSAVRVSETQFPELHATVQTAARILDLPAPSLFVQQSGVVNAFTFGVSVEKVFVTLHSSLVDLLTPRELLFVIGHELGHIKSNHTLMLTLANLLRIGLEGTIPLASLVTPLLLMAWQRRAEITCDRAGLLVCQDPKSAMTALTKLALGSRRLIEQVNVEEFLQQARDLNKSLGRWSEWFATHPFIPKRVRCLQLFAESEIYLDLLGIPPERFISREDLERHVGSILAGGEDQAVPYREPLRNTDALELLGIMSVAWADGMLTEQDREEIRRLMVAYQFDEALISTLDPLLEEKLSTTSLEEHLRYFTGEKRNVFYAALEYAFGGRQNLSRKRKNALYRLAELCGLDSLEGIQAVAEHEQSVSGSL